MKICIISFSGRANGNCSAISAYLKELYGDSAEEYRFADFSITPCGCCDHQCFQGKNCPHIGDMEVTLLEAVASSDLAYFIVPNYCGYPCSNFFVFHERCVCWTWGRQDRADAYGHTRKKFIVVSNSGEDNFRQVFRYQGSGEPDILFLGSRKYGNSIMASQEARETVKIFADL